MRLDGLSLTYRSPYLFRLRPTLGEMRARLEERVAERTRIAQDLHDTVLQGIISAAMQLDVAVDQLPANSPAKLRLSHVLELMRHVMEEGRNAVRGLRSSNSVSDSDSDDLGQAFSRIPQDLGIEVQIDFRVIVLGSARKLHPLIRDEVYHIGRELLVNAFRHSRASCIEVELEYAPKRFRISRPRRRLRDRSSSAACGTRGTLGAPGYARTGGKNWRQTQSLEPRRGRNRSRAVRR